MKKGSLKIGKMRALRNPLPADISSLRRAAARGAQGAQPIRRMKRDLRYAEWHWMIAMTLGMSRG